MPSLMDTTPPPILAEMQAMKEQMEVMMKTLKGCVFSDLNDLVNRTDSPFTIQVNFCPLPQKFRMPQVESYDGVMDPIRSSRNLQDFDAPPGSTGRDHVKGLPYNAEGRSKNLV